MTARAARNSTTTEASRGRRAASVRPEKAAEAAEILDLDGVLDEANASLRRTKGMLDEMGRDLRRLNRKLARGERRLDRKIEENWRSLRELVGDDPRA